MADMLFSTPQSRDDNQANYMTNRYNKAQTLLSTPSDSNEQQKSATDDVFDGISSFLLG